MSRAASFGRRSRATLRALVVVLVAMSSRDGAAAANKAPAVALTAPVSGTSFSAPAAITLSATASDPDGNVARVDFYRGTVLLGTRTVAPYSLTWTDVPIGTYSLTAKATDNAGASKTSTAATITVTAPKVAILQPAPGSRIYGSVATVSGTFSGEVDATITVDGPLGSQLAIANGTAFSSLVPIVAGANTLRVSIARRNRTFDIATVDIVGGLDPLVTFTSPAATVFDAPATVSFTADALSPVGTIAKVDFFRNGVLFGSALTAPYQATWANAGAGAHTITAVATDDAARTGAVALPIIVNGANAPPSVQLSAPTQGAVFTAPAAITVTAAAGDSDGVVTRVEFLHDGTLIGATNVAPYSMVWGGVPAGHYVVTARAIDDRSAMTTSAPVTVTVNAPNAPPVVTLSSPVVGATFLAPATIALAANASDSDGTVTRVDFYQGAVMIASKIGAPFSATWSNVASGDYSLTAKATDNNGATADSAAVGIHVAANMPPMVVLTHPAANSRAYAPAAISLGAEATDVDGAVVRVEFLANGAVIGSAAAPPFATTWAVADPGDYALTARAYDDRGAVGTSAAVPVTVAAPGLTIDAPAAGATIASDHVNVRGTFDVSGIVGITVNGVPAAIAGNRYYANDVPLEPGSNTVTAQLATLDGLLTERSTSLTSLGPPIVRFEVGPTAGFAPLSSDLQFSSAGPASIVRVEIDTDGDGAYDRTLTMPPWSTNVTYLAAGSVDMAVRVTLSDGTLVAQSYPFVIDDRATRDATLRAVWAGMTSALAAGDKPAAMQYLSGSAQQRYGPVFDLLLPSLGQIVGTFSDLHSLTLADGFGEYAINRIIDGKNRVFLIYFGRSGDGLWRVESM